ncbi:SDR family oxidoreductase [Mucilaginibacter sabulilitoris]|uniref:SDR family oxidoreductase n=1 Tax=Mucilaginibacter sabulilitoris TaxID=1173583 RepID=A0ABZ0TJV0_9SPHI|nr:SDR family oxidoreductase [Mucilaginibacter sabulilitoris]WPU93435.1 SDR family oxidoreductase [Mucilaginibacter sabulilitoris]
MILNNKNAIIYGAGGSLGGAVAKALAASGARVFLTGRNIAPVQQVADEILAAGGSAETAVVDALNEAAIKQHLNSVVVQTGTVDIIFNAIGVDVIQNIPLVDLPVDDFVRPVTVTLQTQFLTAAAAGKVMMKQGSGVILSLTATPGGIGYPYTGGFAAACCALECFSCNLASELGVYGVRVVNMRSGGSPDSRVFKTAIDTQPEVMAPIMQKMKNDTMLKSMPLMADIANLAVFLVSDMAAKITGVTIDITCGTTAALNYRAVANAEDSRHTI